MQLGRCDPSCFCDRFNGGLIAPILADKSGLSGSLHHRQALAQRRQHRRGRHARDVVVIERRETDVDRAAIGRYSGCRGVQPDERGGMLDTWGGERRWRCWESGPSGYFCAQASAVTQAIKTRRFNMQLELCIGEVDRRKEG